MSLEWSSPDFRFALDAVRRACGMTRAIQAGMNAVQMVKGDLSPVTVADYAAQAVVAKSMMDTFPGAVLVGEEGADALRTGDGAAALPLVTQYVAREVPGASPGNVCDWIDHGQAEPGDRFWTLDPVDGTKGYLRGGQYAVALALIENGAVQLGVLGCPSLGPDCTLGNPGGVLVAAIRGHGAARFRLDGGEDRVKLRVSSCAEMRSVRVLKSQEASHTDSGGIGKLMHALGIEAEPVSLDSQAKYALLAAGEGELLLRLLSPKQMDYKERIWDQAAGAIVVEEAGGRITDLDGKRLDFTRGKSLDANRGICASNGPIHDAVLGALASLPQ